MRCCNVNDYYLGEGRGSAGCLLANGSAGQESLRDRGRRDEKAIYRTARKDRQCRQRGGTRTLRIRTGGITVGARVVCGLIGTRVMVVMLVCADRHPGVAHDDGRPSVDGGQHEARRYEGAQE